VMANAGSALMGIGSARGEDRAVAAAEMAVSSPLLEASIDGAHGVLLSIAGGSDLGLFEINEAASLVQEAAHPEANIIFGTVIDDSLGDEVRITVIAAGFEGGTPTHKELEPSAFRSPQAEQQARPATPPPAPTPPPAQSNGNGHQGASGFGSGADQNGTLPPVAPYSPPAPRAPEVERQNPAMTEISTPAAASEPAAAVAATAAESQATSEDDVDVPPFMRR